MLGRGFRALGKKPLLAGFLFSAYYWAFDSFFEAFIFAHEGGLLYHLFPFDAGNVIWHRIFVVAVVFGYSLVVELAFSAQRRLEDGLRENEERYRKLVELSPDAIVVQSSDEIVFINSAGLRLFGAGQLDEILGRAIWDFAPPELHGLVKERYHAMAVWKSKAPFLEQRLMSLKGKLLDVEIATVPITYKGVASIQAVIRDVSMRRSLEDALESERRKLDSIVNNMKTGVLQLDRETRVVYANRVAEEWFGPFSEIEGKLCSELFRLKDPENECAAMGAMRTAQTVQSEDFVKTVGGHEKYFYTVAAPIIDDDGEVSQVTELVVEITERKQAEETIARDYQIQSTINKLLNLSLQDMSLENILEQVIDIITSLPWLTLEAKGGIFLVEDEAEVLVLKAHRGLNKALQKSCATVPFGRCLCGRAALAREIEFANELDDRHDNTYDGIVSHGHYCVPILSSDKVMGVFNLYVSQGHNRDKREDDFLQAVADVLAGIIERKRTEEKLRQYSIDLEQSNKMKDLFIDIMRHDLLNPIGVTRGMAEISLLDDQDPDRREIMQRIFRNTNTSIEMIESASILARLDSGERLEFKEMDMAEIVEQVIEEVALLAEDKNTEVKFTADNAIPAVINPLVHDVVLNLVTNSIKYGPDNAEVTVEISDEEGLIRLSVSDHGEGIEDENKESIFDRFKRVEKGAVKGTGLGLAIVKRVVLAHSGRVWVEDNSGGGSIFIVTFPKNP